MAYATANGDIRSTRGAVNVRSRAGQEISWNLIFGVTEALPGEWTFVSVVLREDHGWQSEPLGGGVTAAEMKEILADASELLIRGDIRVFGQGARDRRWSTYKMLCSWPGREAGAIVHLPIKRSLP